MSLPEGIRPLRRRGQTVVLRCPAATREERCRVNRDRPPRRPAHRRGHAVRAGASSCAGGACVFLSGVTAAPVYHSHPHRDEEFDLPADHARAGRADHGESQEDARGGGGTLGGPRLGDALPHRRRRAGRPQPRVGRVPGRPPAHHDHGRGLAPGHARPLQARDQRHRGGPRDGRRRAHCTPRRPGERQRRR